MMIGTNIAIILSPILVEDAKDKSWLMPREVITLMLENYLAVFGKWAALDETGRFLSSEEYVKRVWNLMWHR
jgi:hypothetical protein